VVSYKMFLSSGQLLLTLRFFYTLLTPWPLVRKRTIPTERPPLVGEVSANFLADRGSRVVRTTDPPGR
jgi:hypothetical protein